MMVSSQAAGLANSLIVPDDGIVPVLASSLCWHRLCVIGIVPVLASSPMMASSLCYWYRPWWLYRPCVGIVPVLASSPMMAWSLCYWYRPYVGIIPVLALSLCWHRPCVGIVPVLASSLMMVSIVPDDGIVPVLLVSSLCWHRPWWWYRPCVLLASSLCVIGIVPVLWIELLNSFLLSEMANTYEQNNSMLIYWTVGITSTG